MTTINFQVENNHIKKKIIVKEDIVEQILKNEKFYKKNVDSVVFSNINKENNIMSPYNNGLLGTIIYAYSNHTPLVLKPDDLWFAITLNFSRYINKNSKELKSLFVKHENKIDLQVNVTTLLFKHMIFKDTNIPFMRFKSVPIYWVF
jgi:hypothetical protein